MKNFSFLPLLFIIVFLLPARITQAEQRPLIGAQISLLEADNLRDCKTYFKNLKSLGYNTIILRVFHNPGDRFHGLIKESTRNLKPEGVYFTTRQVPVIADILTPICKCAHQSGLIIFAWMNTLKADYNHKLKQKVLTLNQKSGEIEPEKNLLDPTSAENINFLIRLFADLASHPIDGILLQDDLMLRHNQGFKIANHKIVPDSSRLYNFSPQNRIKIESYKPYFKQWRKQQSFTLQTLANQIFTTCRKLKPTLLCAQNIHYEVIYKQDWGCDWFAWSRDALNRSTADYFMIMSYQERIRKELELISDHELSTVMQKIFTNALQWQQQRSKIIFKFETPLTTDSNKQRKKSLATLHKTITLARKNNRHELVLTPCNTLTTANSIKQ